MIRVLLSVNFENGQDFRETRQAQSFGRQTAFRPLRRLISSSRSLIQIYYGEKVRISFCVVTFYVESFCINLTGFDDLKCYKT